MSDDDDTTEAPAPADDGDDESVPAPSFPRVNEDGDVEDGNSA